MQRLSIPTSNTTKSATDRATKPNSARRLVNLAQMGEQLPSKPNAPTDVSEHLDHYAWEHQIPHRPQK